MIASGAMGPPARLVRVGPLHRGELASGAADAQAQEAWLRRLDALGLAVVPSLAEEVRLDPVVKSNLSLIISMVHWKGKPINDALEHAWAEYSKLEGNTYPPGAMIRLRQSLCKDGSTVRAVARHIFDPSPPPTIFFLRAGGSGAPVLHDAFRDDDPVNPATVPNDALVIRDSSGYLEVVANISGRPWSLVLRELGLAPRESSNKPDHAWVMHSIKAAREMEIRICDADGNVRTQKLKRGLQTHVALKRIVPTALPHIEESTEPGDPVSVQAQKLARVQDGIDGFWRAMEQGEVSEYQRGQDGDACEMLLGVSSEQFVKERRTDGQLELAEYIATLHLRQGRVVTLALSDPTEPSDPGRVAIAYYDNPWSREVTQTPLREQLTLAGDFDAFDLLARVAASQKRHHFQQNFVEFLNYLAVDPEVTDGWEEFLGRPSVDRRAYLSRASEAGLHADVLEHVRWAIRESEAGSARKQWKAIA